MIVVGYLLEKEIGIKNAPPTFHKCHIVFYYFTNLYSNLILI